MRPSMLSQTWRATRINIEGRISLYDFPSTYDTFVFVFGERINLEGRCLLYAFDLRRTARTFMAGHGRPWPAIAGHGLPWPAMAGRVDGVDIESM